MLTRLIPSAVCSFLRTEKCRSSSKIKQYQNELVAIRHDLHAHPEIGFEEVRTSGIVANLLEGWGITVHRGIGGTGVVGELKGKHDGNRRIGLRADMDALPIQEETGLPYASTVPGKMHACGHDGHTTILLGAARYLAETRDFAGTAVFVFQPAEEGLGGARAMLKDGLFQKFPCDEIYGLHNAPNKKPGRVSVFPGAAMAGADFFDFRIKGRGSHGARPNEARDPIIVATAIDAGAADHRQPQQPSAHAAGGLGDADPCGLRLQRDPGGSHNLRHRARVLRRVRARWCASA